MNNNVKRILVTVILGLFFSCNSDKNSKTFLDKKDTEQLYTILSPNETNISFQNNLKESLNMNGLLYEYFYNGAGVAVGDLNDDGLSDIYFVSGLESNKLYLNKGKLKFQDVTDTALLQGGYGFDTGVTMVDINSDGKLDIYVSKSGKFNDPNKRRNELYINKGNDSEGIPIFEEDAVNYGLDLAECSTQASFFDYDRDGDLDMFIINHGISMYPDVAIEAFLKTESDLGGERLYRNDNGKFIDVTKRSGIINNMIGFGLGISIGDLNNDGWPDVIVGHDYSEKDHMYMNQKNGTFKEVIKETTGHISNYSMGNDIADFNNDGLLDFITLDMMSEHNFGIKTNMGGMDPKRFNTLVGMGLHHQYMYNALQINNGIHNNLPRFSDIAQLAGVSSTDWSWAPLFFDMDNDGFKDLFVSNGIKRDFRNNDFVNYQKKKQEEVMQLKKEGKTFDQKAFIKDILDKMPGRKSKNYFFRNNGNLTFSNNVIADDKNIAVNSNGAAYADLDNDGDLDIVVNNADDISLIYKNNSSDLGIGNYLSIKLEGPEKNTIGIGARLIATQKDKQQIVEQYMTRGYQSSVDAILHFGLGKENVLEQLKIIWPDGKVQELKDVDGNRLITVDYRDAKVVNTKSNPNAVVFADVTLKTKVNHKHQENEFDDFKRESLLPHKMSNFGPGLAVGDINNDGLDDFYVGGAKGFSGELYVQKNDNTFDKMSNSIWKKDANCEDVAAAFFDADSDGDLDLYVVSGGNENAESSQEMQDRLYLNKGKGGFTKSVGALPKMPMSGSTVKPCDFDGDGDLDLFIGGRQIPGKYPFPARSYLLKNESKNGKALFVDVTDKMAPEFRNLGMITAAEWVDVTGDKKKDLVIVGEWTPVLIFQNEGQKFTNSTKKSGMLDKTGWWFSVVSADMDNDGDMDLVAGNLGRNYKYKTSFKSPFGVYATDFDNSGTLDIVLSYYDLGKKYPLRGRTCSSGQMPFIKKKFPTYNEFGAATLSQVYGDQLDKALHYNANTFGTTYFENDGKGHFKLIELPIEAQFSSVNDILIDDFNQDGFKDIVLGGNLYASEVETPRNDAGFGLLLTGNGKGNFKPLSATNSGLFINGDVKNMKFIKLGKNKKKAIIVAKNNDYIQIVKRK
jgi:hypothetical protein